MSYKVNSFYQKLLKRIFNSKPIEKDDINNALSQLLELKGSMATSIIDWEDDIILGTENKVNFDITTASKGNGKVMRSTLKMLNDTNPESQVEDILITLTDQIHIIHIINSHPELCLYIILDSQKANMALARTKIGLIAKELSDKYESTLVGE